MLSGDIELGNLTQGGRSHVLLRGCDSPECYSGTSLRYNSENRLVIYDWVGMSAIPDYEVSVPANEETMKKYFPSHTPSDLKRVVLDYIRREGRR